MSILSKKIISNTLWIISESLISIIGLVFVTSYMAKYLDPENFGKIVLVTSIFIFVQTISWFGNQELFFKRVSRNKVSGYNYLYNTQKTRKYLFLVLSGFILLILYKHSDFLTFIFGMAAALSAYFAIQDIYLTYNHATLNSYINAISNIIGLSIAFLLRYVIVYFSMDYVFFSIPIVLITLVPYLLRKYYYNKKTTVTRLSYKKYSKYYFLAGSSLLVYALSLNVYTQINSIILAKLTSLKELGIFTIALTLGTAWTFINNSFVTSVMSKIYQEKNGYTSYSMLSKLNYIVISISIFIIICLVEFGDFVIGFLYGSKYNSAYDLLLIIGLSALLNSLGVIASKIIIKEGGYSYLSKKMVFVAVLTIIVSYIMILNFGLHGAAWSVLIVELLSLTIFNYFYENGLIFKIHFFPFFKKSLKLKYRA